MENHTQNKNIPLWFLSRPKTSGFIILVLLLSISGYITLLSYENQKKSNQNDLANIVRVVVQNIYQSLDHSKLAALSIALTVNDDGVPENFEKVASEIIKSNASVDAVQLVPGGVIKYVYPYEENKVVIGYDILKDESRSKEAYKAIEQKQIFFGGPFELKQGGVGIVGRLPIYIRDKFWGFSAVVIKLDRLIDNAGIDLHANGDYLFQLSKINPLTKETELFIENDENVSFENAETAFFPQGEWTLHAIRKRNLNSQYGIISLAGFGILFSMMSAFFVIYILRTPSQLQKLVVKQSKELIKSGQRNNAIMEALPDMLFILDEDGNFIFHHNPTGMPTLHPPEEFIGQHVTRVLPPQLAKEVLAITESTRETGNITVHNYQLEKGDKIRYYEARFARISKNEVLSIIREITRAKETEEEILVMNQKLRNLSEHLQNVREEERASLSRELHDELGQQLTAISLDLHWLKKMSVDSTPALQLKIKDALSIVQEASATVKRINTELRPAILDDLGLFAAIEWQLRDFKQRNDIQIDFVCECDHLQINPLRSIAIFRMVQESLNNIAKHSKASNVSIKAFEDGENLNITITDDGVGFISEEVSKKLSFGLLGMNERANMLNGSAQIVSNVGIGTSVEICLPLAHLTEELSYSHDSRSVVS